MWRSGVGVLGRGRLWRSWGVGRSGQGGRRGPKVWREKFLARNQGNQGSNEGPASHLLDDTLGVDDEQAPGGGAFGGKGRPRSGLCGAADLDSPPRRSPSQSWHCSPHRPQPNKPPANKPLKPVAPPADRPHQTPPPQRDAGALQQHAVPRRHLLGRVRHDRDGHVPQPPAVAGRLDPREVRLLGVRAGGDDLFGGEGFRAGLVGWGGAQEGGRAPAAGLGTGRAPAPSPHPTPPPPPGRPKAGRSRRAPLGPQAAPPSGNRAGTWQFRASNSLARSENAMISVWFRFGRGLQLQVVGWLVGCLVGWLGLVGWLSG